MKMRIVVGCVLLLLPFVGVTVAMVKSMGWRDALWVWGAVLAILGCAFGGAILITG